LEEKWLSSPAAVVELGWPLPKDLSRRVLTSSSLAELDKARALIDKNVTTVQDDATSTADLDRLFEMVRKEKGKLDILVANSGLVEPVSFEDVTEAHFDKTFDLNARAALFTAQKAVPLMREGGSDHPGRFDRWLHGLPRVHHL
jgi:NAD(P)-dependent dehydrogenase (short-subunit alcohol dehydrogenase family)